MTQPSAKIIKDSISEMGHRLVTMEVVMHRFILAEFNTHRVFSRNSASSRAIPYENPKNPQDPKTIRNRVVRDPAFPVVWPREQPGMSGGDSLLDQPLVNCMSHWLSVRNRAIDMADLMYQEGLHKSLINRLLEPFMWHTAIVTATEWANFFHQRCDKAAQPEMKALADAMQLAYYQSTPEKLDEGEWHLPYIEQDEWVQAMERHPSDEQSQLKVLKFVSTARCARVSYLTHDGVRSIDKDIELYDKLIGNGHWSPFEHVATPIRWPPSESDWHSGNFRGWMQFRKQFPNENRVSFTPNLPELEEGQHESSL